MAPNRPDSPEFACSPGVVRRPIPAAVDRPWTRAVAFRFSRSVDRSSRQLPSRLNILLEDVRVDAQRHDHRGVPEALGDDFRRHAGAQGEGRRGAAHAVDPDSRQPDAVDRLRELRGESLRSVALTGLASEDEIGVRPLAGPGESLLSLSFLSAAQRLDGACVEGERTFGGVGLPVVLDHQLPPDLGHGLGDPKPPVLEVDIRPAKPAQLGAT